MRKKEGLADYCYFLELDIFKLRLLEEFILNVVVFMFELLLMVCV